MAAGGNIERHSRTRHRVYFTPYISRQNATGVEKITQLTDSTCMYVTLRSGLALEPVVTAAYYTDYYLRHVNRVNGGDTVSVRCGVSVSVRTALSANSSKTTSNLTSVFPVGLP